MSASTLSEPSGLLSLPLNSKFPSEGTGTKEIGQPGQEDTSIPPHRSHDLSNNLKRSDPFKFGSRLLEANDDVFEFNAWDHVTPDDSYYAYAEAQFASQRASPVSEFDKKRFNSEPAKWWNKFYSNNTSNFFKNRKWLHQEFPILSELTTKDAGPATILEVGAGAGNTAFPILAASENEKLMIHACDFSSKAVDLIRNNESYNPQRIRASVWDISGPDLPEGVVEGSVDVVLLIFIFSALHPGQWDSAVKNVARALKTGGEVCFRDYGRGDLTQVRFKKGRLLEESFYIRGDGTRVYFFTEDELRKIWGGMPRMLVEARARTETVIVGEIENQPLGVKAKDEEPGADTNGNEKGGPKPFFDILSLGVDRRMLVNRKKELKMYRCWMQGRFKKPKEDETPG